jgi:hypothetical protein
MLLVLPPRFVWANPTWLNSQTGFCGLGESEKSKAFWEEMATWTNWLANTHPPWAAYQATIWQTNSLIALGK